MSWTALGADPVPGDEGAVRALAARFATVRDGAEKAVGQLRTVDGGTGPSTWTGPGSEAFQHRLGELGPAITHLADSHDKAREALEKYADALADAQALARRAEADGERALADQTDARSRQSAAEADSGSWAAQARAAQEQVVLGQAQRAVAVDPVYAAQLDTYLSNATTQGGQARSQQAAADARVATAAHAARDAADRLAAAQADGDRAARDRTEAAHRCIDALDAARPRHDGWLSTLGVVLKAARTGFDTVKDGAGDFVEKTTQTYERDGKELTRWAKGFGPLRAERGINASTAEKVAKKLGLLGYAVDATEGVEGGVDQWNEDGRYDPDMSVGERGSRAVGAGVATGTLKLAGGAGAGYVGGFVGGVVGSFGGPVGTVAGVVVGAAVGTAVGEGLDWAEKKLGVDEAVQQIGAAAGSVVYDDLSDMASTAKGAAEGVANTAGSVWKSVSKWHW